MQMLPNKTKNATRKNWISTFFGRFLTKKQQKLTKNEENWQNSNRLIKFSENWYVNKFSICVYNPDQK